MPYSISLCPLTIHKLQSHSTSIYFCFKFIANGSCYANSSFSIISSTQIFLSAFNTPQPHEVPTSSYRTPTPDINMYVPRDTNVDPDADDDDHGDDSDNSGS